MTRPLGQAVVVLTAASSLPSPRHPAFLRGTLGEPARRPSPGNTKESRGPHAVEGSWRRRHRPTLRRAFLGAAIGGLAGLAGRHGAA